MCSHIIWSCAVSWKSIQQPVVALSTTEEEFMAITESVKEGIWLIGLLSEFGFYQDYVPIKCNSQSALHLSKHHVFLKDQSTLTLDYIF